MGCQQSTFTLIPVQGKGRRESTHWFAKAGLLCIILSCGRSRTGSHTQECSGHKVDERSRVEIDRTGRADALVGNAADGNQWQ